MRVTAREEVRGLPLTEVRDRVEADWKAARTEELLADVYSEIEARYDITTPSADELEGLLN